MDLLFCHRPDIDTPIEETVWAMNHVIEQGKALYWGTSEWSAEQIRRAHDFARREHLIPPTMEQPQYNMFHRDRVEVEYAPLYDEIGLGTTIWSPLATGILTGKYNDGIPDGSRMSLENYQWLLPELQSEAGRQKIAKVKKLAPIAEDLGCTMAQLAIAWCLSNDDVSTVITGASRPEQVTENMKALEVAEQLTPDVQETHRGDPGQPPRGRAELERNVGMRKVLIPMIDPGALGGCSPRTNRATRHDRRAESLLRGMGHALRRAAVRPHRAGPLRARLHGGHGRPRRRRSQAIAANEEPPTFANTIEALDAAGALLTKVSSVFGAMNGTMTNDEMQAIAKRIAPLRSKHRDEHPPERRTLRPRGRRVPAARRPRPGQGAGQAPGGNLEELRAGRRQPVGGGQGEAEGPERGAFGPARSSSARTC